MKLEDLFVSYEGVDPVEFKKEEINTFHAPYLNIDRARKVVAAEDSVDNPDNSHWIVGTSSGDWKVEDSNTEKPKQEQSSKWVNPYANTDRSEWIQAMTDAYRSLGLNNNAIKNLIAKNALESGWGKYAQGDFNYGNITHNKYWKGKTVKGKDNDADGKQIDQVYRAYSTLADFVKDEKQFLEDNYDFNPNDDFDTFMNKLQGGNRSGRRYATATDYIDRVRRVYNGL